MTLSKKNFVIVILVLLIGFLMTVLILTNANQENTIQTNTDKSLAPANPLPDKNKIKLPLLIRIASSTNNNGLSGLALPIDNALARVTKKTFGLYVSPDNSPVSPERFTGYHTGVDFETTPEEQNIDVPIYAICPGPLILKKSAGGYGSVAVQQCQIQGSDVTVIYGHLRLNSITPAANQTLQAGQQIGILGKGYSTETDGERKHLHLGIHKGTTVNLLGYVQNKQDLSQWIDALILLK